MKLVSKIVVLNALKLKIVHFLVFILNVFLTVYIKGNRKLHKHVYYEGNLLTHHYINISENLQESINKTKLKLGYVPSDWRILIYYFFVNQAVRLNGAYVELGVGKGAMSLTSIPITEMPFKSYYLIDKFDSFTVNSKTGRLNDTKMEKIYASSFAEAKNNFSNLPQVNLIQGTLPGVLDEINLSPIAFLHIDLNAAEPEVNSLKKLWPLIMNNGYILLDDYCWGGRKDQFEAMNKLATELKFEILSLPTGQGLIIK
jgi:hypothetical protein